MCRLNKSVAAVTAVMNTSRPVTPATINAPPFPFPLLELVDDCLDLPKFCGRAMGPGEVTVSCGDGDERLESEKSEMAGVEELGVSDDTADEEEVGEAADGESLGETTPGFKRASCRGAEARTRDGKI